MSVSVANTTAGLSGQTLLIADGQLDGSHLLLTKASVAVVCDGATANNDLNIGSAGWLRLTNASGAAGCAIGGFTGGTDGRILFILNKTGQQVTFAPGGTAANQIDLASGGEGSVLNADGLTVAVYDGTTSRWYIQAAE